MAIWFEYIGQIKWNQNYQAADGIRTHDLLIFRTPYESAALTELSHGGPDTGFPGPNLSVTIVAAAWHDFFLTPLHLIN